MAATRQPEWICNASLGILAWCGLELLHAALGRARGGRASGGREAWQRAGACACAALLAAAYARLVPREHWGVRSGVAFSQLRLVSLLARTTAPQHLVGADSLLWGAATGALMRVLGEAPAASARLERWE